MREEGGWKKRLACSFALVSQSPILVYANLCCISVQPMHFYEKNSQPETSNFLILMEQQKILQNFGEEKKIRILHNPEK